MVFNKGSRCFLLLLLTMPWAVQASEDISAAIQLQNEAYMEAYRVDDVAGIVALHTANATVIAPKFPPSKGHEEIHAALVEELALGEDGIWRIHLDMWNSSHPET